MKNKFKKLAIGAAATAALGMNAHAQSADALIDKLVEKGILTSKEANDLRDESDNNFNTAFQTKTGMPDWVTGYKLSGDVRARFDGQFADQNATVATVNGGPQKFVNRDRLRYRLRIGLGVSMRDDVEVGFRLGSGDNGNPLSNNQTLNGNASKKPLYVDAAYGRWTPIHEGAWNVMTTFGKMDQPFQTSSMMFDPDYTPEGAAAQVVYKFNDTQSLKLISGAFVLNELQYFGNDPYYYGGQIIWDSSWTPKIDTSLGLATFNMVNKDNLSLTGFGGTLPSSNLGNTRSPATGGINTGVLKYNYNPIVADASFTYKLASFPFYNGIFPIKLAGEYLNNPGSPTQNEGYWFGVTLGKSGTKKTWDISYRYEYLEADAWFDQLVDDDNAALYASDNQVANFYNPYVVGKGGFAAGTNMKGHMIKFNYSVSDALTLSFSAYMNSLILPVSSVYKSDALHVMGDIMWKF